MDAGGGEPRGGTGRCDPGCARCSTGRARSRLRAVRTLAPSLELGSSPRRGRRGHRLRSWSSAPVSATPTPRADSTWRFGCTGLPRMLKPATSRMGRLGVGSGSCRAAQERGLSDVAHALVRRGPGAGLRSGCGRCRTRTRSPRTTRRPHSSSRLDTELGYGLAGVRRRLHGHAQRRVRAVGDGAGLGASAGRLTPSASGDTGFEVSLDATRRETANDDAEHGVMLRSRPPLVRGRGQAARR